MGQMLSEKKHWKLWKYDEKARDMSEIIYYKTKLKKKKEK